MQDTHLPDLATPAPPRWSILAAFAAVYLIWGSTYLAIRIAIETMPPLLMLGVRFGIAGLLLHAWARWRGAPPATARQWRSAALMGLLMPFGGTGAVAWAEQFLSSGLAALVVATLPLWITVIDVLRGGVRPGARAVAGLVAGFAGVALLFGPQARGGAPGSALAIAVLMIGCVSWALGSVISRRLEQAASPALSSGMQMTLGGVFLVAFGLLLGEGTLIDPARFSLASLGALAYLIVFGSLIAFSSFLWLLRVAPPAQVATYAYVNPVVALFLGWLIAGEVLNGAMLAAAAVILGSVALILKTTRKPSPTPPPQTSEVPQMATAACGE